MSCLGHVVNVWSSYQRCPACQLHQRQRWQRDRIFLHKFCFHLYKPPVFWMPCESTRFVNRRWTFKKPIFDNIFSKSTMSQASCSQTEVYRVFLHSNFTWRSRSWKLHEKVFLRIYPHFRLCFAQNEKQETFQTFWTSDLFVVFPLRHANIHTAIQIYLLTAL